MLLLLTAADPRNFTLCAVTSDLHSHMPQAAKQLAVLTFAQNSPSKVSCKVE